MSRIGMPGALIPAFEFSPDRRHVAVLIGRVGAGISEIEAGLQLHDVATGRMVRALQASSDVEPPLASGFSQDGALFAATTTGRRAIGVWDMRTGMRIATLPEQSSAIASLAFSPDRTRLASVGADGAARLWDIAQAQEAMSLREAGSSVREVLIAGKPGGVVSGHAIEFSADGRQIVLTVVSPDPKGARITIRTWEGPR
jgi:WD40 repeat protein